MLALYFESSHLLTELLNRVFLARLFLLALLLDGLQLLLKLLTFGGRTRMLLLQPFEGFAQIDLVPAFGCRQLLLKLALGPFQLLLQVETLHFGARLFLAQASLGLIEIVLMFLLPVGKSAVELRQHRIGLFPTRMGRRSRAQFGLERVILVHDPVHIGRGRGGNEGVVLCDRCGSGGAPLRAGPQLCGRRRLAGTAIGLWPEAVIARFAGNLLTEILGANADGTMTVWAMPFDVLGHEAYRELCEIRGAGGLSQPSLVYSFGCRAQLFSPVDARFCCSACAAGKPLFWPRHNGGPVLPSFAV